MAAVPALPTNTQPRRASNLPTVVILMWFRKFEAIGCRSIIGWPRNSAEDWRANMRRMKDWKQLWNFIPQFRLATSFASKTNKWPILAASWSPLDDWKLNFVTKPRRRRGRPSCRWDDRLSNFAECRLKSSWPEAAKRRQQWVAEEQFF